MCAVERERESSRVELLSHVAFLPAFRLLSGSRVVPREIKKINLITLPPTSTCQNLHKGGTVDEMNIELKMVMDMKLTKKRK